MIKNLVLAIVVLFAMAMPCFGQQHSWHPNPNKTHAHEQFLWNGKAYVGKYDSNTKVYYALERGVYVVGPAPWLVVAPAVVINPPICINCQPRVIVAPSLLFSITILRRH